MDTKYVFKRTQRASSLHLNTYILWYIALDFFNISNIGRGIVYTLLGLYLAGSIMNMIREEQIEIDLENINK